MTSNSMTSITGTIFLRSRVPAIHIIGNMTDDVKFNDVDKTGTIFLRSRVPAIHIIGNMTDDVKFNDVDNRYYFPTV